MTVPFLSKVGMPFVLFYLSAYNSTLLPVKPSDHNGQAKQFIKDIARTENVRFGEGLCLVIEAKKLKQCSPVFGVFNFR